MAGRDICWLTLCLLILNASARTVPNAEYNVSSKMNLTVLSNWRLDDHKVVVAIKGSTVELQCGLYNVPGVSVSWMKDRKLLKPSLSKYVWSITYGKASAAILTRLDKKDAGNYSCDIRYRHDSPTSHTFYIHVKENASCKETTCPSTADCVETIDGYTCKCKRGYSGPNCTVYDACIDSPCLNGGRCKSVGNGGTHSCFCYEGYGGSNCETELCLPDSCGNEGVCNVVDRKRKCTCPDNRAGSKCQHECSFRKEYCGSKAKTCYIRSYRYTDETCKCETYRKGKDRCMMSSDVRNECNDPKTCSWRGTCTDYVYGYNCDCNGITHGKNCEFSGECSRADNLCKYYGGTCVDLEHGYKCINCPDGQYGDNCQYKKDVCQVQCNENSMVAACHSKFMNPKLRLIPIYLNQRDPLCQLSLTRRDKWMMYVTVNYTSCGTQTDYKGDSVVYRNYLRVGNSAKLPERSNSPISRNVGHFSFKMECNVPLVRTASSMGMNDLSLLIKESTELEDSRDIDATRTNIGIYNADYSKKISNYTVGDRIYVKMTVNSNINVILSSGYTLQAVTCFATPDQDGRDVKYTLMKDRCILDETLLLDDARISASEQREVYFSFDSFSFKSKPGKLYLHCTSRACPSPKSGAPKSELCGAPCKNTGRSKDQSAHDQPLATNLPTTTTATSSTTTTTTAATITKKPGSSVAIFSSNPSV